MLTMSRLLLLFLVNAASTMAYSPVLNKNNHSNKRGDGGVPSIIKSSVVSDSVMLHYHPTNGELSTTNAPTTSRREMMIATFGSLAAATALPFVANAADDSSLVSFTDPECNFSILVPSGWDKSVQELADRRKIVLYVDPKSQGKTLMFIAYTPVRDDFTSLGSFGSVDNVAQMTILPKGELAGLSDIQSTLLSAEAKQKSYIFDYKQIVPGQPEVRKL